MPIPATILPNVPTATRDQAEDGLERAAIRFAQYFEFTSPLVRATPEGPPATGWVYPNASMVSDVTMLWSLYSECYQAIGGYEAVANVVENDAYLKGQLRRLIEADGKGSFWHFPAGEIADPVGNHAELEWLLRTLRNGYAHFRWEYGDVSAGEYWDRQGWSTTGAPAAFNLAGRRADNYMGYIVDAKDKWTSSTFWNLADLRIVVTWFPAFRYRLHSFLNHLLHDRKLCIFAHDLSAEV